MYTLGEQLELDYIVGLCPKGWMRLCLRDYMHLRADLDYQIQHHGLQTGRKRNTADVVRQVIQQTYEPAKCNLCWMDGGHQGIRRQTLLKCRPIHNGTSRVLNQDKLSVAKHRQMEGKKILSRRWEAG